MNVFGRWSRRQFIAGAASSAGAATWCRSTFGQSHPALPQSAATSPEETQGGIRPLLVNNTALPIRYQPEGGDFVIRNGREFFNRPLYGPNNSFRVDAGDLPEFSLYLPGHGGNLRLGISSAAGSKWLFQADEVVARYRPGRMLYTLRDRLLGAGSLDVEILTAGEGSGLHLQVQASGIPAAVDLIWAFGGVSGRKGKRGGDIGCEVEPVSRFFQLRSEECRNNSYIIHPRANDGIDRGAGPVLATLHSPTTDMVFVFPDAASLRIADAEAWDHGWLPLHASVRDDVAHPVLIGSAALVANSPSHITIRRLSPGAEQSPSLSSAALFAARREQLATIAATTQVDTPDPYVNAAVGALNIAADAIWDASAQCVMHGAVAWRTALAGWRGPYALGALGAHTRLRQHSRHWIARQNVSDRPSPELPATGAPDPGSHLTRKENILHSRGDLSHNHYDMNLVFFDALLRDLKWTGDLDFVREIWPALLRHLEWERCLFRRTYKFEDQTLPLYEAYACIWASDNLQYSGGGAAHSSAYNYYANRSAAVIAKLIGEDGAVFQDEADLILEGMQKLLWLPEQGAFGESKDILGPQMVYTSPAIWTVYHTIDSEVASPRQAWQMVADRLAALKKIPVQGPGIPHGDWFLLSCSDWLPYIWSLNLVALAENMHMALALWHAGRADEAFQLFKGNVIDSMFRGLCPGNFHMSSELDVRRQESQRDFGDPIGITARALVEGLFGLKPDLLRNVFTIRPGFPSDWKHASLRHPDAELSWRRDDVREVFEITPHFAKPVSLALILPALRTGSPSVIVNGVAAQANFDEESTGIPALSVSAPAASHWRIEVEWRGGIVPRVPEHRAYRMGERLALPHTVDASHIDDPQHCLNNGHVSRPRAHVVFVRMQQESCAWWMPISFETKDAIPAARPLMAQSSRGRQPEAVDLSDILQHRITDIFKRSYTVPRSPYCSLAIPEQGAGAWAAFDTQPVIDDAGLRAANGQLKTPLGISFRTPSDRGESNCLFLSHWQQDRHFVEIPLTGKAASVFLLMAGSTFPQASRMTHGAVTVGYADGSVSELALRTPDNWWPIEQDYLLDDYLFVSGEDIPPRVDLRSGRTRLLDPKTFRGLGREVEGGAANILTLQLDPAKDLAGLRVEVKLYGIVIGLLGVTLVRPG